MDRFYLSPDQWGESPALTGDEAHHCCRVMRKQVGDAIQVFDGWGRAGEAQIVSISKTEVCLELSCASEAPALRPQIEIAVGVPKGKTFDLILQKAVEMGVSRIQPLTSEQGNVRFKENEGEAKREKWQRSALEACKQCGQNFLPEVAIPQDVGEYLKGLEPGASCFVGALTEGSQSFRPLLDTLENPTRIVLMIGPEGDFSEREYGEIFAAEFAPVTLGELVLRTETAVFWMVAAVRYHFQS